MEKGQGRKTKKKKKILLKRVGEQCNIIKSNASRLFTKETYWYRPSFSHLLLPLPSSTQLHRSFLHTNFFLDFFTAFFPLLRPTVFFMWGIYSCITHGQTHGPISISFRTDGYYYYIHRKSPSLICPEGPLCACRLKRWPRIMIMILNLMTFAWPLRGHPWCSFHTVWNLPLIAKSFALEHY